MGSAFPRLVSLFALSAALFAGAAPDAAPRREAPASGTTRLLVVSSEGGQSHTAEVRTDLFVIAVDEKDEVVETFEGRLDVACSDAKARLPKRIEFKAHDRGVRRMRAVFSSFGKHAVTVSSPDVQGTGTFWVWPNPMEGARPKRLGDVDGDGRITGADVALVRDFRSGKVNFNPVQYLAADFNRDGVPTEEDVALITQAIGTKPADREPPEIEFQEPCEERLGRSAFKIRLKYGDEDSGVDSESLIVFSERRLDALTVGPSTNIVTARSPYVDIGADRATIDMPERAMMIGRNTLAAAILDRAGNIGFAKVRFNVPGIQIVHAENPTIGRPTLFVATYRLDDEEEEGARDVSWRVVKGAGDFSNARVYPRARVATVNLFATELTGVDVPLVVVGAAVSERGKVVAEDESLTVYETDDDKPHVTRTEGGLGVPGHPERVFILAEPGPKNTITSVEGSKDGVRVLKAPRGGEGVKPTSVGGAGDRVTVGFEVPRDAPEGFYIFWLPVAIGWTDEGGQRQPPIIAGVVIPLYVFTYGSRNEPAAWIRENLQKIRDWIAWMEQSLKAEDRKLAAELKEVLQKAEAVASKDVSFVRTSDIAEQAPSPKGNKVTAGRTIPTVKNGLYTTEIQLTVWAFQSEKEKLKAILHELRHAANYQEVNEEVKKQRKATGNGALSAKDVDKDGDGVFGDKDKHPDRPDDSELDAEAFGEKFGNAMDP